MYRYLLLFLFSTTATPAPQSNADITYFKLQPVIKESDQQPRESRIENLPLTIPGNANTINITRLTTTETVPIGNSNITATTVSLTDVKLDTDSFGAESKQSDVKIKEESDFTTTNYETTEAEAEVTARFEDLIDVKPRKHVSKFGALSKYGGHTTNLIDTTVKRRFRSRCRCEKIWNCPKLQISVPRCPEEQFLCCF